MKFLISSLIAICLLGICNASTSLSEDMGQGQSSIFLQRENIFSIHKSMTGVSADTLGVVPDGHKVVITDLVILTMEGYNLNVELWGNDNLRLTTLDLKERFISNFTTGIPFTSCETIWIKNVYNSPIEVTVNGYVQ